MDDSGSQKDKPQPGTAPVLTDPAAVEEFMGGGAAAPAPSKPQPSGAAYQPTVPLQAVTVDQPTEEQVERKKSSTPVILIAAALLLLLALVVGGAIAMLS